MYAAVPPNFCDSASMCCAKVDFPADSGPNISVIRPRGIPPMPSATSSDRAPVGIAETLIAASGSPNLITAPLPKSFVI